MLANDNCLVRLDNVGFHLEQTVLVRDISFSIDRHDVISLIGPNGAGKSTLVKLILGLLTPTDGQIYQKKGLQIGYVPQKFALSPTLPLRVADLLKQARSPLTDTQKASVFDSLTLAPLLNKQVTALSGGELQRVLLARALLDKPELLVLDEPMQGIDPQAQSLLYELIDTLPDFLRCAMLVVSHDLHWVMKGTKQVLCLNKHICCQGTPSDVAVSPEFVALFGSPYHASLQTPYIHHHNHCHHPH